MELIFNPYGEFHLSPEGPVSQIHSPHLHDGTPGIFSDPLRSVQTLKRSGVRKATGTYCIYSSLVKLQPWFLSSRLKTCLWAELQRLVPGLPVKDLPLGITAILVPERPVKDLPLGRTLMFQINFRVQRGTEPDSSLLQSDMLTTIPQRRSTNNINLVDTGYFVEFLVFFYSSQLAYQYFNVDVPVLVRIPQVNDPAVNNIRLNQ